MSNYAIAEKLKTPIAIITGRANGAWKNDAFDQTFGSDAQQWLKEGARAVAGETGWLQGLFLGSDEDARTTDVEIEGRTYRVERIKAIADYGEPAVALWFEDVTAQREME